MGRNNLQLNEKIEREIEIWNGTAHGVALRNMYKNGASYEAICDIMGVDIVDYEEE